MSNIISITEFVDEGEKACQKRCALYASVKKDFIPQFRILAIDVGNIVVIHDLNKEFAKTQLRNAFARNGNHSAANYKPALIDQTIDQGLAEGIRQANRQAPKQEPTAGQDGDENKEPPVPRPIIQITNGLVHEIATKAEELLIAAETPFYARGGAVVRPIIEEVDAAHGYKTKAARLTGVTIDTMTDHLSRNVNWHKFDLRRSKYVPTDPPRQVIQTILSRDGEWKFPALAGIITTPTLRPDGSILRTPGYDSATRLLLVDPPEMPHIPSSPTRADAEAALAALLELVEDFPFSDPESRAVALSGLMTPVVRGAMPVAPLHCASAPTPGTGKSYLVDLCSAIATGQRCPVIAAGRTEEETEKRLVGAALAGYPIISIDNVNGELGGDLLCQMVERQMLSLRPLGGSGLRIIESKATMFATGNNITPRGDLVRRTLRAVIDANVERPELRQFRKNPYRQILANRGRYVAAIITIVRAHVAAGHPAAGTPLASFESWSEMVRNPLIWLGCADPVQTIETAREEDPELLLFAVAMVELEKVLREGPMTSGEIKDAANRSLSNNDHSYYGQIQYQNPELRQVLLDAAGFKGEIDTRRLGHFLARYSGRINGNLKLTSRYDRKRKQKTWLIQKA